MITTHMRSEMSKQTNLSLESIVVSFRSEHVASSRVFLSPSFSSQFNRELTFIYRKKRYNNKQKVKRKNESIKGFILVLTVDNGYSL